MSSTMRWILIANTGGDVMAHVEAESPILVMWNVQWIGHHPPTISGGISINRPVGVHSSRSKSQKSIWREAKKITSKNSYLMTKVLKLGFFCKVPLLQIDIFNCILKAHISKCVVGLLSVAFVPSDSSSLEVDTQICASFSRKRLRVVSSTLCLQKQTSPPPLLKHSLIEVKEGEKQHVYKEGYQEAVVPHRCCSLVLQSPQHPMLLLRFQWPAVFSGPTSPSRQVPSPMYEHLLPLSPFPCILQHF